MVYLIVALSILLTTLISLVILAQDGKGGGFTPNAAGAAQVMGVKKTTDILEKLTWGFISAIIVVCVSTSFIASAGTSSEEGEIPTTVNMDKAKATAPKQAPQAAPTSTDTAQPTTDSGK